MPLSEFTQINIDIDVYRAIEARRSEFNQNHNDILRTVFGLGTDTHRVPPRSMEQEPAVSRPVDSIILNAGDTQTRRTGLFTVELLGDSFKKYSLKDAYLLCLRLLSELDPDFLDNLSQKETRARRIVAQRKENLYKNNPRLAEEFAVRLLEGWWVDTNLSRNQIQNRLKTACEVAGIRFGSDLTLNDPNKPS